MTASSTSPHQPPAGRLSGSRVTVHSGAPSRGPWLKIAAVAVPLLIVAVIVLISLGGSTAGMPETFPNALIPLKTNGTPADVHIVRAAIAPGKQDIDGVECWPAWQCNNTDCPGRSAEAPFIFPFSDAPATGSDGPYARCPRCATAKDRKRDPTNIAPYFTAEALELMQQRK